MISNGGIKRFRSRNRFRIAGLHLRSLPEQFPDNLERRRESDVISIRLERQSQHRDAFTFDHPQCLADFVEKLLDALLINTLRSFQDVKIDAHCAGQMDERLQILGKTKTAETQS